MVGHDYNVGPNRSYYTITQTLRQVSTSDGVNTVVEKLACEDHRWFTNLFMATIGFQVY